MARIPGRFGVYVTQVRLSTNMRELVAAAVFRILQSVLLPIGVVGYLARKVEP